MKLKHLWAPLAGALAISIAGATPAMAVDPAPPYMSLTGTPKLGEYMTITTTENLKGDFFDIWMCPNKDILPRVGVDTGSECVAVSFWERFLVDGWSRTPPGFESQTVALNMKWLISDEFVPGLNPSDSQPYLTSDGDTITVEPPEAGSWCEYAGWYLIINDFGSYNGADGLGYDAHSNWSEAFSTEGCPEGSGGGSGGGSGTLPDTGASSTAGIVAGSLGLVAVAGGLMLVRARRLGANGN